MTQPTQKTVSGYDDRTIGLRLRRVRKSQKKSLRVIAQLAGISEGYLSRIERGERAIDSRKLLLALAIALKISPTDLTTLPVPRPANGNTDGFIESMRRALMAVAVGRPGGHVQSVEQLQRRYQDAVDGNCKHRGVVLPNLIADMHTTLAQRQHMAELLPLAVTLHGGPTWAFLYVVGAAMDLRWQQITLARTFAEEFGDPVLLGFIARGAVNVLIGSGAFDLARDELDATTVPTATNEGRTVNGMLALHRSLVSAAGGRASESVAALDHASELAARTAGDAFTMGFDKTNVGLWRMTTALEYGNPDETIRVARTVNPHEHPYPSRQAAYWIDYGRALASIRRRDDAARALLRAEKIHPVFTLRNPLMRDTLVELIAHAKDDALGRAIRGMAYRASLPV